MARRRRVVVLVFCLTCLAANFIYSYQESPQLNRSVSPFDGAIQGVGNVAYSAAGWPWAFYERIDRDSLPSLSHWNLLAFVGNLLVWGLIFAIAWWRGNSHQPVSAETKPRRRLHLSLADLFVLMLLVACLFGYIASNRAQYTASQKLVQLIRNHRGTVSEGYYWPSFLYNDFFVSAVLPRNRIVGVSISNPSESMLKQIVSLPYLHSLCLDGSDYSLEELLPALKNPHLQYLRISGRDIDRQTLQRIGQSSSLQAVNFATTNITDSELASLGEMRTLRHLNLERTQIRLKDVSAQPWMNAVRYLRLPSPSVGEASEMQLDGWPELVDVRLVENDERSPPAKVVGLSITNCPKLQKLSVADTQRFDLKLQSLPQFSVIETRKTEEGSELASLLAVQSVYFKDLPSLKAIHFEIRDFEQIRIDDCPTLQCNAYWSPESIKSTAASRANLPRIGSFVFPPTESMKPFSDEEFQRLIQGLGQSNGITSLNLAWMSVPELDLSPIAACRSLKHVTMPVVGLSKAQLQQLSPLSGLEEIQICKADELTSMLDTWPNLRRIEKVDLAKAQKESNAKIRMPNSYNFWGGAFDVHLTSAKNLESILMGDWRQASSVYLSDMPQLSDLIQLSQNVTSIQIEGTPKLKGLLTFAPWPADSSIDMMTALEAFAAGGDRFGDKEFAGIEQSKGLRSLTLGYCAISPEKFSRIGSFENLTALGLSGSKVNDDAVKSWSGLKRLHTLMLDRTQITAASVPWICSLSTLKNLSIDANCMASVTDEQLGAWKGLTSLSIYGQGVAMKKIANMKSLKNLSLLRIENAILTKQMLTTLLSSLPKEIRLIDLCFCRIDPRDLDEFVSCLPPSVNLGIEGLTVNEELKAQLLKTHRAVIEDDGNYFLHDVSNYTYRSISFPSRILSNSTGNAVRYSPPAVNNSMNDPAVLVKPSLFAP